MEMTYATENRQLTIKLSGELDHHAARELMAELGRQVDASLPRELYLDLGGVGFMDSSGIGLVMGRYRLMQNFHGTLEIRNVTLQTKKLMELAGLGSIAIIKETA